MGLCLGCISENLQFVFFCIVIDVSIASSVLMTPSTHVRTQPTAKLLGRRPTQHHQVDSRKPSPSSAAGLRAPTACH